MQPKRLTALALSFSLVMASPLALASEEFSPYVDTKGNISLPQNFRLNMVHLGAWFVPEGGASGFHDVFTDRKNVVYFQKNGIFPDGAVLVKELRGAISGDFTTGKNVQHSTSQLKQWFVMVKDSKNRFTNNPIWGDGWGWALFKPDNPSKNVAQDYKTDCLGCHVPAKQNDWLYTQGYPILSQ